KARLHYEEVSNERPTPSRNWEDIHLPIHPQAEFHPLKNGDQFVFTLPERDQYGHSRGTKMVYFGGMDEEPFLVRLNSNTLGEFETQGEKGFFEALKPKRIQRMEIAFGKKTKRQGDFFVMQTPFSWKLLRSMQTFDP